MKRCKICGAALKLPINGIYTCELCTNTFTESDFEAPEVQNTYTASPKTFSSGADVYENNINGILEILTDFNGNLYSGSGFLISDDGYAITNAHVVTENGVPCRNITVRIAGEIMKADIIKLGTSIVSFGTDVDLALIKLSRIPLNGKVIKIADFEKVRIGDPVYVIGNSLGDGTCITSGIVSDKRRIVDGQTLMMTDCATNGGNSGGPIFNIEGNAIGAIVAERIKDDGTAAEGMNYAIPSDIVLGFISGCAGGKRLEAAGGAFTRPYPPAPPIVKTPWITCKKCGSNEVDVQGNWARCLDCDHVWQIS